MTVGMCVCVCVCVVCVCVCVCVILGAWRPPLLERIPALTPRPRPRLSESITRLAQALATPA